MKLIPFKCVINIYPKQKDLEKYHQEKAIILSENEKIQSDLDSIKNENERLKTVKHEESVEELTKLREEVSESRRKLELVKQEMLEANLVNDNTVKSLKFFDIRIHEAKTGV